MARGISARTARNSVHFWSVVAFPESAQTEFMRLAAGEKPGADRRKMTPASAANRRDMAPPLDDGLPEAWGGPER